MSERSKIGFLMTTGIGGIVFQVPVVVLGLVIGKAVNVLGSTSTAIQAA